MPTIAEQLAPMVERWAVQVLAEAADSVFQATQAFCPIDQGTMLASGTLEGDGALAWRITYDDVGYTDEGPQAHMIEGNPLLAFDWPERGLFPAVFRHVFWQPGPGVAENKGWFTDRAATQEQFENALQVAANAFSLDDAA